MMAAQKPQVERIWLKQLMQGLCDTSFFPELEIKGIALDSRKVEPGYLFVALQGQLEHGLAYAETAVSAGAVAVLCDAKSDQYCQQIMSRIMSRVICVAVNNLQQRLGEIASRFYADPSHDLYVSGITGTDGKTSVSHFIAQAMQEDNHPAALMGTLGNGVIDELQMATHTTPDVISVQQLMRSYADMGVKSLSMEVSSHGLDQHRVSGVEFDVAVLTNVSRDHLDYHGTLQAYKDAKKKLFTSAASKVLVFNADDEFGMQLFNELCGQKTCWLYGMDPQKVNKAANYVSASDIRNGHDGISFLLSSSQGVADVTVSLIGEFNIYNALACMCVLLQSGMNFNHAVKRLERLHTVPGRMQLIAEENKPAVVIDYAHTPQALTQALMNVRKHTTGRVICVFGCGGDRDAGKRPLMARAAEELADLVIVTNDNPRNENEDNIIDDIKQGFNSEINLIVEKDRARAIAQALKLATKDDLVLIAGKGHEQYQQIGENRLPFSDVDTTLAVLVGVGQ